MFLDEGNEEDMGLSESQKISYAVRLMTRVMVPKVLYEEKIEGTTIVITGKFKDIEVTVAAPKDDFDERTPGMVLTDLKDEVAEKILKAFLNVG